MTNELEGIVVLESPGLATAYCGKLLHLLGATVIKLEPQGGDPVRNYRTPSESAARLVTSSTFVYNNLGKSHDSCDLATEAGHVELLSKIGAADVFLTDWRPAEFARIGTTPESLVDRNPRLIVTAVTPFGLTGPARDFLSSDLTALASGGQMFLTGYPDRTPVKYGGWQGYKQGSVHAAYGTLLALIARLRDGRGQVVDVSMQECVANSLQTTMQLYDLTGQVRTRVGSRLLRCRDGFVRSMGVARGWPGLLEWLNDEGFAHNLDSLVQRLSPSERPGAAVTHEVDAVLGRFFEQKTKRQILTEALQRGIAIAPVNNAADVLEMPELDQRRYWATVIDEDRGQEIRLPAAPFRIAAIAGDQPGPAPFFEAQKSDDHPPLEGLVVLDFTWYGAGAMATRVLAHFGATVIKVESSQRIDGIRLAPPFRGDPGINKSGFFNNFNSGKLSITLDMRNNAALSVARRLVSRADVVVDNFSPGVLESFGLSDDVIHDINRAALVAHMPMGGTWGPLRDAVGFGATIEAVSGLVHLTGDLDTDPVGTEVNYPDYGSNPYHATTAILAGLLGRARGQLGQVVEVSQIESTIAFVGESLVEAQRTRAIPGRRGNESEESLVSMVAPCRGFDEWCAISCFNDEMVKALLANVPEDGWVDSPESRHQADGPRERIAAAVFAWTRTLDKYELASLLQRQGVAAYPVTTSRDLAENDRQLASRNHYIMLDHPEAGLTRYDGPSVRLSRTVGAVRTPAPCLGQHTMFVLHDILGLTVSEISRLETDGALV